MSGDFGIVENQFYTSLVSSSPTNVNPTTTPPPPCSTTLPPPPLPPQVPPPILLYSKSYMKKVFSPTEFIPARYSGDGVFQTSYFVRLEPYLCTVLSVFSSAQPSDFKEHEWLLRYGETEVWYSKPRQYGLEKMAEPRLAKGVWMSGRLVPFQNPRPACIEYPKCWASAALTTPKDNDIFECNLDHHAPKNNTVESVRNKADYNTCTACIDEKSEALKVTPLTYCLVFTTTNISDRDYSPHYSGTKSVGEKIYRLVKCGSRQTAVVEAFYASGVNRWNLAFSCVLRDDEDLSRAGARVERVEQLWQLSEENQGTQDKTVRVFY